MNYILHALLLISSSLIGDPSASNIHNYMWATYQHAAGNKDEALERYNRILSSDHVSVYTNKGYIPLLADQGNYKRIVELIPKLDSTFKNDADMQLLFVNALKKTGNSSQADERLLQLCLTFKSHPEIVFNTAEVLVRRKEHQNALSRIDDYLNSSQRRPNNFIFYFLKAQIYTQLHEFKSAREEIQKCLDAHPRFPQGWLLMALIEEQSGQIDKAIEGYTSYLEVAGTNAQIEQHLLELALKQKNVQANTQILLVNKTPFEKAVILFDRKQYKAALTQIDVALDKTPTSTEARLLKIQILSEMKEFEKTIQLLMTWSMQDINHHIWLQALHLLARIPDAPKQKIIDTFNAIHSKDTTRLLPILYLSDLNSRFNSPAHALPFHTKALALVQDPELKTRILYQIAAAAYDEKKYPAMVNALQEAINLNRNYPPALNLMAYYCATEGKDLKKAQDLITIALQKDVHNPHFNDTQALIHYKKGDYQKALALLEPIAALHDSTILIHLGKTYHRLGQLDKAKQTIALAQKHAHNNYEKQTTQHLLELWKKS